MLEKNVKPAYECHIRKYCRENPLRSVRSFSWSCREGRTATKEKDGESAMSGTDQTNPGSGKDRPGKGERFVDLITRPGFTSLLVFVGAVLSVGWVVYLVVKDSGTIGLPALALLSIILLLGALLIFTTLISAIGLSDKNSALGLPDGSVRAILALALLGLFAILASSVLTEQVVDEFGKQILTLVGTLMTAVISFYFGSSTPPPAERAGAQAAARTAGAPATGGAPAIEGAAATGGEQPAGEAPATGGEQPAGGTAHTTGAPPADGTPAGGEQAQGG
jgi:hypothetical protein